MVKKPLKEKILPSPSNDNDSEAEESKSSSSFPETTANQPAATLTDPDPDPDPDSGSPAASAQKSPAAAEIMIHRSVDIGIENPTGPTSSSDDHCDPPEEHHDENEINNVDNEETTNQNINTDIQMLLTSSGGSHGNEETAKGGEDNEENEDGDEEDEEEEEAVEEEEANQLLLPAAAAAAANRGLRSRSGGHPTPAPIPGQNQPITIADGINNKAIIADGINDETTNNNKFVANKSALSIDHNSLPKLWHSTTTTGGGGGGRMIYGNTRTTKEELEELYDTNQRNNINPGHGCMDDDDIINPLDDVQFVVPINADVHSPVNRKGIQGRGRRRNSCSSSSASSSSSSSSSSSLSSRMDTGAGWQDEYRHRPSWCDAATALRQVKAAAVIISLVLLVFCIGLKDVTIQTDLVKLWVPTGGKLDKELNYLGRIKAAATRETSKTLRRPRRNASLFREKRGWSGRKVKADNKKAETGLSGGFQVIIQTPRTPNQTVLSRDELLMHAKMLTDVATLEVDMYGQSWSLSDICFKPPTPSVKVKGVADQVNALLDRVIPCIFISPLDCFWDGAKPLGPFPSLDLRSVKFLVPSLPDDPLSWKNLDPTAVLKDVGGFGIPLGPIQDLFDRAGIGKAYTDRPCIDPFERECPKSAPNKADACRVTESFVAWNNRQPEGSRVRLDKVEQDPKTKFTDDPVDYDYEYDMMGGMELLIGSFVGGAPDTAPKTTRVCAEYKDAVIRLLNDQKQYVDKLPEEIRPKFPNYGEEMTGGCMGFARKILNWPEEMILGGLTHAADGTLTKAESFQSVMMVASPYDVYLRYKGGHSTKPGLNVRNWTHSAAYEIVAAWQRNFTELVYNMEANSDQPELGNDDRQFHPLASTSVGDMLKEFSKFKPTVIIFGYFLMIFYAGLCLGSYRQRGVQSASGLGVTGVLLVTFASLAGLGFSTWVGIEFNAATTQIVPFLTLGLGVDDMFLLVHSYQETAREVEHNEIGHLLKETGLSVMLTSINNILAFSVGGLLPVPALRSFCFQTAILLFFNMICIITLFPAVIGIDIMRRKANRVDILCCLKWNDRVMPSSSKANAATANGGSKEVSDYDQMVDNYASTKSSAASIAQRMVEQGEAQAQEPRRIAKIMEHVGLDAFVSDFYAPFLSKMPVKIVVLVFFACLLSLGTYGCTLIHLGLELTDVIPTGTAPYAFLRARERYFSFYPMHAVIKSLDFPNKQRQIDEYKTAIAQSQFIVKNNGKLGDSYWLPTMKDWLKRMQDDLDGHRHLGLVDDESGVRWNGTDNAKIAFKLICQQGDVVDCDRNKQGVRLLEILNYTDPADGTVHNESIVRRDLFYNAVTAWYKIDNMMYYVTQAGFHPTPPTDFPLNMNNFTQPIPPASPMLYSRIPFFLNGLTDTEETVAMIREIRAICDHFTENGLPNFPEGIPFTFWEQYLHIVVNVLKCVAYITITVFVVISLLLMNPWTAGVIVFVLVNMVVELSGAMGLFALKLNPVSSVSLITAVGIGVEFTVHISVSYLTNMGSTDTRLRMTLEHMFAPVLHGGISTFLGIVMLAFSEFPFIVLYFFLVMSSLILLGLLNGLILLPVLLTLIGPPSEVRSIDGSGMVPAPSGFKLPGKNDGEKKQRSNNSNNPKRSPSHGDKPSESSQINNNNNNNNTNKNSANGVHS